MQKLKLWDMGSEATGPIICYTKDKELLDLWVSESNLDEKLDVYIIGNRFEEVIYTIANYICHKYELINSFVPSQVEAEYFESCRELLCLNNHYCFKDVIAPKIIYKSDTFFEYVRLARDIRCSLLSSSPWGEFKGVEFDHVWWNKIPTIQLDLEALLERLKRIRDNSPLYSKIMAWANEILSYVKKMHENDLASTLYYASAFFYASAKYSRVIGDNNKAILLLHRCVDLYFQYQGVICNLVTKNNEGLVYFGADSRRDVGFELTKTKLLDTQNVFLDEESLKKINRINFIRNRNYLTHSLYGIKESEIDDYMSNVYSVIRLMEGDSIRWRNAMSALLSKPDIDEYDIYLHEDSFDSFVEHLHYDAVSV